VTVKVMQFDDNL